MNKYKNHNVIGHNVNVNQKITVTQNMKCPNKLISDKMDTEIYKQHFTFKSIFGKIFKMTMHNNPLHLI